MRLAILLSLIAAGNASAGVSYAVNTTMTIPYPATASGDAVDLTAHYTSTSYTSAGGAALISATGTPFTQSTTTPAPDTYSQVFDSPGPAVTIAPGKSETLQWTITALAPFEVSSYETSVDVPFAKEWMASYEWSGVAGTFVPISFATQSASGVTQLQIVNQLPATGITYSDLSVFNGGSFLLTGGSGSIAGGGTANVLAPFTFQNDFAMHVKDDNTGSVFDVTWGVYNPVPEPATTMLVGVALGAGALWLRRRRAV